MCGLVFYVIKRVSDGKYLYGLSFHERVCGVRISWVDGMDSAFTYTIEQASAIITAIYTFDSSQLYVIERFTPEA